MLNRSAGSPLTVTPGPARFEARHRRVHRSEKAQQPGAAFTEPASLAESAAEPDRADRDGEQATLPIGEIAHAYSGPGLSADAGAAPAGRSGEPIDMVALSTEAPSPTALIGSVGATEPQLAWSSLIQSTLLPFAGVIIAARALGKYAPPAGSSPTTAEHHDPIDRDAPVGACFIARPRRRFG